MLEIKGMARSTFYYNNHPKAERWSSEKQEIESIFHENQGRYSYRRITTEMHNRGYAINHKTVRKLMVEIGVKCAVRMKRYRSYKGEVGKAAPNLLKRDFKSDKPLQKLTTDVTEFALFGKKRYLSPVMDMFNGEIISYTLYEHPVLNMVMEMMKRTVEKVGSHTGAILHSDQGWAYRHRRYQEYLSGNGFIQSMSRKGNCLDNAMMENFFGLLKSELLYMQEFSSIEDFERQLHKYITYYNEQRIKTRLYGKSPVEYRKEYERENRICAT